MFSLNDMGLWFGSSWSDRLRKLNAWAMLESMRSTRDARAEIDRFSRISLSGLGE